MGEYQSYEFLAVERPLTAEAMDELRAISARAEITGRRFWNEYHWGELKADPAALLERWFDVHVYASEWGSRRLMLRVPRDRVDEAALVECFVGRCVPAASVRGRSRGRRRATGTETAMRVDDEHIVLDFVSEPEDAGRELGDGFDIERLAALRDELVRGDVRCAYLGWLARIDTYDVGGEDVEPPVPPGLSSLTDAQWAMVELLDVDPDLVRAAAAASGEANDDQGAFEGWVAALGAAEARAWLARAAADVDLALGGEMLRAFRAGRTGDDGASARSGASRRTVAQLRERREALREERLAEERARAERAREAAEAARARHLTELGRDLDGRWAALEKLVAESAYDDAVSLAVDLRDLALRDESLADFDERFAALKKRWSRRRAFFDRWARATKDAPARGASPRGGRRGGVHA